MSTRLRLLAAPSVAVGLLLLAACQYGTASTSAAASSSTSTSVSTSASAPPPAPAPSSTLPGVDDAAAESAVQSALQQAQAAASSARVVTSAPAPSVATTPTRQATATWPPEAAYPVEGRAWAVYLAVSKDGSAGERSRLEAALQHVRTYGYAAAGGVGPVSCEAGAAEALHLDPQSNGAPVFFATRAQAEQFVARYDRPYVGYAQVTENCIA